MSLGIIAVGPGLVVCASDRRLTRLGAADRDVVVSDILKEGSTKLTYLVCDDALAMIGYIGIGEYSGRKPSDWLMDLAERIHLARMRFHDALVQIALAAEKEIARMPATIDRRHTFYFGALINTPRANFEPCLAFVSNFERVDKRDSDSSIATENFQISWNLPRQPGAAVVATGATDTIKKTDTKEVIQLIREGAHVAAIRSRCAKIIKDSEFRRQSRGKIGTSGTSVTWGIIQPGKGCEVGLDVPGGTTVIELPNQILPNMLFKAPFVDVTPSRNASGGFRSRFFKPILRSSAILESLCPHCGAPVPEGYRKCGICHKKVKEKNG